VRAANDPGFVIGSAATCYVTWSFSTAPGYCWGAAADPYRFGLDMVIPAFFSAMLVSLWQGPPQNRLVGPWAARSRCWPTSPLGGFWYVFFGRRRRQYLRRSRWMNSHDPLGYVISSRVMTVVVYLTRAGGFWLIGRVRIGPRAAQDSRRAARRDHRRYHCGLCCCTVRQRTLRGRRGGDRHDFRAQDFAAVAAGLAVAAFVRRRLLADARAIRLCCPMPLQNRVSRVWRTGCGHAPPRHHVRKSWWQVHRDDKTLAFPALGVSPVDLLRAEIQGPQRDVWGRYYTDMSFSTRSRPLRPVTGPCFECRRKDAERFATLFSGGKKRASAVEMDRVLHAERLIAKVKRAHPRKLDTLPDGAMIALGVEAFAVRGRRLLHWTPKGYSGSISRPRGRRGRCFDTAPSILAVLSRGYAPLWHPSATR
jgi:hypothetical protein